MKIKFLIFPKFNPVIFSIYSFSLCWYNLMYLISFAFTIWLVKRRKHVIKNIFDKTDIETFIYASFLGVLCGGRIGYVLFYNIYLFFNDPIYLFKINNGGMSFHGGLVGGIIVILWFSCFNIHRFLKISDFISPIVPFGLGAGRLGNFINGELWGRVTINIPWAMLFPKSQQDDINFLITHPYLLELFEQYKLLPRHPTQIYEMLCEGIILFIIINVFILKPRPVGVVSGFFLIYYGVFRILIEFLRQPDAQIGLFLGTITMGQILSIPIILSGIIILIFSYRYYI